ncbi:PREDICTED: coiled-coil domain-containing protein 134-like [Dufourea novaeangliae]|uniref:coiled-coil domain-containing protein 134-like n=1 Tax=Dufourea novaeangliae TaxID=178035 RepID=UPI0007675E3F|nr:PREDICTED: coiled-coil domain-containing protein 134-like [Dufourea novaeangliae]
MPRAFVYMIAVVSVLTFTAHTQQVDIIAENRPIDEESRNGGSSENKVYEELFKKSFVHQRREHADAVKRLERIDNYERLYKMIMVLGEKMIDVIESSKSLIEDANFNPDDRLLPRNVTVQSALSTVLENTALFGDIVLHFPEVSHRVLKMQPKWSSAISWSVNFTSRSGHFLDEKTIALIGLVAQELNITERKPGYSNPYQRSARFQEPNKEAMKTKGSSKKEKRKRGPRITITEF